MKVAPGKGPQDAVEYEDELPPAPRGLSRVTNWVRQHPWWTALIVFAVAACIVVVIVAPVCAIQGCPKKNDSVNDDLPPGLPRLIVNFKLPDIDALEVLPPILREYVGRLKLVTSNLQILDFIDEDTLQEALKYLRAEVNLDFLTRDFNMTYFPPPTSSSSSSTDASNDPVLASILAQIEMFGSGRRMLQHGHHAHHGDHAGHMDMGRRGLHGHHHHAGGHHGHSRHEHEHDSHAHAGHVEHGAVHEQLQQHAGGRRLAQTTPNDPFYVNGSQYYINTINSTGAWSYNAGSAAIVIAILDTGVALDHPDIKPNLWVNTKEIPGNGIDDDGNGFVDDIYGWDFAGNCTAKDATGACTSCGPRNMPYPTDTHGTHVAGLIAAVMNNGIGITGVAPNVRIMVLRVSDCKDNSISSAVVASAMDYALRMGAHIVSCSFGNAYDYGFQAQGPAPSYHADWIKTYTTAITPLRDRGVLVVAAAGNENINMDLLVKWGWAYNPCLVNLTNVLCVGATDNSDQRVFFSNYGSTSVHLGAPGYQIYSTIVKYSNSTTNNTTYTYAPMNGTSMSTPIVSGAAALALNALSSSDANYYKATQVRNMLLSSANKPSTSLPWLSGSRINAGLAVFSAMKSLGAAVTSFSALYTNAAGLKTPVRFRGFVEVYVNAVGNQFSQDVSGTVLDTSIRAGQANVTCAMTSFKYGTGVIVREMAYLQLNRTGVFNFWVKTDAPYQTFGLYVNDVALVLNTSTNIASFTASTVGWYKFELRIAYPTQRFDLYVKGPAAASFVYNDLYFGAADLRSYVPPAPVVQFPLSAAWQVFYNKSVATDITPSALGRLAPNANYQYSTVFTDLSYTGVNLPGALFPGDATATAAMGYATTLIRPNTMAGQVQFKVVCKGCQVLLNDMVVLDAFEALTLSTSLTKVSACITISVNETVALTMRFASNQLSATSLILQYTTTCGGTAFSPLSANIASRSVWWPEDMANMGTVGFIGGVQCDVWRTANGSRTTAIAAGTAPTWKARLPNCADDRLASTCTAPWSFTLESVFPGLTAAHAAGTTFAARCWTHLTNQFTNGVVGVGPTTVPGTAAYLGGRKVYGSGTGGAMSLRVPTGANTRMSTYYQHFAAEWYDIGAGVILTVTDNGVVLNMALATMRLPIGPVADYNSLSDFTGQQVVGNAGPYTYTVLSAAGDVPSLVSNDLKPYETAMAAPWPYAIDPTNTLALNAGYAYGSRIQPGKVRYTRAEGYFLPANYYADSYRITVSELNATSTLVNMGDVTMRNAPAFSDASLARSTTFEVYLPPNYVYTNVIVKLSRWDTKTYFDFSGVDGSTATKTVLDNLQWSRTFTAPYQ